MHPHYKTRSEQPRLHDFVPNPQENDGDQHMSANIRHQGSCHSGIEFLKATALRDDLRTTKDGQSNFLREAEKTASPPQNQQSTLISKNEQTDRPFLETELLEVAVAKGDAGNPPSNVTTGVETQASSEPISQASGTSLLDLPPELTEAICALAIPLNPRRLFGRHRLNGQQVATPTICRVNRRLRHEGLPLFYRDTCFSAWLAGREEFNTMMLARAQRWLTTIAGSNINVVRFLSLEGFPIPAAGHPWKCDMDFEQVTLDMTPLGYQKKGLFMQWSLKHAFLEITKGKPWRPTAEGLDVFFQVYAIGFSQNPSLLSEDEKLTELKTRFPQIYREHTEVDHTHGSGEYERFGKKYHGAFCRYVGEL